MKIVASNCLLGVPCRYDGSTKTCEDVCSLCKKAEVLGLCPEASAFLPIPRKPAERCGDRVLLSDGIDVTEDFQYGAQACFDRAVNFGATIAVLKENSPCCGSTCIYDGTHSGRLVPGEGIFTELLRREGICVASEETIKSCKPSVEHPVAIVLGSGLGHLVTLVKPVRRIDYHEIDGFPESARPIPGHSFEATIGTIDDVPVIVYPGRIHLYQGFSALEVSSLVLHAYRLGSRDILFACATGAIESNADLGLGLLSDQINLTGHNPLVGWDKIPGVKTPFIGMADTYSPYLRAIARGVAKDEGIVLGEGVYAGVLGPSFETAAEVAALRKLGASYVGMSTVCEAIMAHALGMNVLGLTLASNVAGDIHVTHESVLAEAKKHASDFERLVRGIVGML